MDIERSAGVTNLSLSLLLLAAVFAATSAISHTQAHQLSEITHTLAIIFGAFALLKLASSAADILPLSLRAPIRWTHAMVFEVLVVLFAIPLLRIFRLKETVRAGQPILLVHGYHKNSSMWFYFQKALASRHAGPIYAINLKNIFGSIRDYAAQVETKCAQIKQETGSPNVVLIGHSMGGLVSSLCALESTHVAQVITIASPLAGTRMAKIGMGQCARDMEIHSSLTNELTRRIAEEARVKFYHIGTQTDQLIIPSSSSLPGTHPNREFRFEDIGHASLLFSPRVAQVIAHWLKN